MKEKTHEQKPCDDLLNSYFFRSSDQPLRAVIDQQGYIPQQIFQLRTTLLDWDVSHDKVLSNCQRRQEYKGSEFRTSFPSSGTALIIQLSKYVVQDFKADCAAAVINTDNLPSSSPSSCSYWDFLERRY